MSTNHYQRLTSALHAISGDDAQAMLGFTPRFIISPHAKPNAYAVPPASIHISAGMLALANSHEELAFVLAHEISHLRKAAREGPAPSHAALSFLGAGQEELRADAQAAEMLVQAGMPASSGIAILTKVAQFGAETGVPLGSIFPKINNRIRALQDPTGN